MKNNILGLLTIISFLLLSSCSEDEMSVVATQIETTESNVERTYTTINLRGEFSGVDNQSIVLRGLCWSTSPNPTENDFVIQVLENDFEYTVNNLIANTNYYFRTFVLTESEAVYSEEKMFSTLSLEGTSWEFITDYPNDFTLHSKVDFLNDYTTVYDELDLPGHCPGCFITYGTWMLDGNDVVYIWEGSDSDNSTYTFFGTLSEMEITGVYNHSTLPDNNWSATIYE